jgi:hypothetical protein
MFQRLALVSLTLAAALFAGCGPTAKERLTGHWKGSVAIDETKLQAKLDASKANPLAEIATKGFAEMLKRGSMDLDLYADDTYHYSIQTGLIPIAGRGKWKVLEEAANTATVELAPDSGEAKSWVLTFDGPDSFTVPVDGEPGEYASFRCTRVADPAN